MKRRSRNTELFSLSFLDVLACALGGVLLLLLLSSRQSGEQSAQAQESLVSLQQNATRQAVRARRALDSAKRSRDQIAAMQSKLEGAHQALAQLAHSNEDLADNNQTLATSNRQLKVLQQQTEARIRELEQLEEALIGLNGQLNNVVFIFDISGSMQTEQFDEYQALLTTWMEGIDSSRFDVISFNKDVHAWRGGWAANNAANQQAAADFVTRLQPSGSTNTLGAFKFGLDPNRYPNLDTVVLFSDGAPTDCTFAEVTDWLAANRPDVVINTVGMGNYFNEAWGKFLHDIARQHDGVFVGR